MSWEVLSETENGPRRRSGALNSRVSKEHRRLRSGALGSRALPRTRSSDKELTHTAEIKTFGAILLVVIKAKVARRRQGTASHGFFLPWCARVRKKVD